MKKRYIVYLGLLLMILFGFDVFKLNTQPVLPNIQLPGENVIKTGEFIANITGIEYITNTFIATVITYLIIVIIALAAGARSRSANEVPTGFYNIIEMIIEGVFGFVEGAAGKFARTFFPFFMTFVLLILVANWLELVPGVDSVGKWESYGELREHQYEVTEIAKGNHPTEEELHHVYEDALEANEGNLREGIFLTRAAADEDGQKPDDADWTIVPFLRVSATDLNFTVALALISVIMTQYYGLKFQGTGYLKKFWQFDSNKIAKNPLGAIDIVVGILELVAEIAKILSFSFRLLGNIFAGQVLLFVIGFLLPVALVAVYGLEFFVGAIQAAVFAMLTLTFMTQAASSHHGEEH